MVFMEQDEPTSALDNLVLTPRPEIRLPAADEILAGFRRSPGLVMRLRDMQTYADSLIGQLTVLGLSACYSDGPTVGSTQSVTYRVKLAMRALSPEALTECVTVAQLAAGALADDLGSVQWAFLVSDEAAAATFDDLCLRRDDLACVRAVLWLAGASDALDAALEDLDEEAETHGLAYREAARRVKRDARHDDIAEGDGWWCLEKSP